LLFAFGFPLLQVIIPTRPHSLRLEVATVQ
jgi:hypothetical protein